MGKGESKRGGHENALQHCSTDTSHAGLVPVGKGQFRASWAGNSSNGCPVGCTWLAAPVELWHSAVIGRIFEDVPKTSQGDRGPQFETGVRLCALLQPWCRHHRSRPSRAAVPWRCTVPPGECVPAGETPAARLRCLLPAVCRLPSAVCRLLWVRPSRLFRARPALLLLRGAGSTPVRGVCASLRSLKLH